MGHEWEGGFSGMIMGWLWNDYEICCWMYPFSIQDLHPAPTATYCNYPIAVPRREELPATQESPCTSCTWDWDCASDSWNPQTRGLLILGVKLSMKPRAQVSPCELDRKAVWVVSQNPNINMRWIQNGKFRGFQSTFQAHPSDMPWLFTVFPLG